MACSTGQTIWIIKMSLIFSKVSGGGIIHISLHNTLLKSFAVEIMFQNKTNKKLNN